MLRSSIVVVLAGFALGGCSSSSHAGDTGGGDASTKPIATVDAGDGGGGDATVSNQDGGTSPTLVIEPDQGMTPIYDFIGTATKTLDMTMYELVDTTVTGLLTQLAAKGVVVRVILDQNLEMQSNQDAYNTLSAGSVQVHWANPTYAATHQKTITVDGATTAIMTLNFASDEYATSRDFAVLTTDAADIAAIETVFAADFANAAITPPTGDNLVWSPTNSLSSMEGLISGAKTALLVENEEMGDATIVSALCSAAARGVDVQVVMESSTSYVTEFTTLVNAGVKLVVYGHSKLYIHAKIILADYGTSGAKVFVGSENFSNPSLTENRELGLITSDPGIMAGVNTTLTSDFSGGKTFIPDAGVPFEAGGSFDAGSMDDAASIEDAATAD